MKNKTRRYAVSMFIILIYWLFILFSLLDARANAQLDHDGNLLTPVKYKVIVVNNNKYSTLGITKYVKAPNGDWDIVVLNKRWNEHIKVLKLEPGHYSITQMQKFSIPYKGTTLNWGKILDYREFKVIDKDLRIVMRGKIL